MGQPSQFEALRKRARERLAIQERVTHLVQSRMGKAGRSPDEATVTLIVQKWMGRQPDPLPATGVIAEKFSGSGVAPLNIVTSPGSNYFIKLVDFRTKAEVLTAFARGGETLEFKVPLGSYELRYAAGTNWYGPYLDFGLDARYAKCDDEFQFTSDASGYSGFTVELIMQENGNLEVDPLEIEQF